MIKPTTSRSRPPFTGVIPDGPITMRLASRILDREPYGVLVLIAAGELTGQKVHDGAGSVRVQVMGESVRAYLDRQKLQQPGTPTTSAEARV
ncbi:hypothetical protein [Gemmatimonas sp.]